MDCSYYGTNEGVREGLPVTHIIMDEFFNRLVEKNEAKLLKKHANILAELRKTFSSDFKNMKKNINIATFDIEKLKELKDMVKALKEEFETIKKAISSNEIKKESVDVKA